MFRMHQRCTKKISELSLLARPVRISDRMEAFLSQVYLGPMYEELDGKLLVGGPLQEVLYFLDPDHPFYKITSRDIIGRLVLLYLAVNDIRTRYGNNTEIGMNDDYQIRDFFSDVYKKYYSVKLIHQRKYGEVAGTPQKYSLKGVVIPAEKRVCFWSLPLTGITDLGMDGCLVATDCKEINLTDEDEEYIMLCINLARIITTSICQCAKYPERLHANAIPFKKLDPVPTSKAVKQ